MLGNRLGRSSGLDMHHDTPSRVAWSSEVTGQPLILDKLRRRLDIRLARMTESRSTSPSCIHD
jgi:hypothetical protein